MKNNINCIIFIKDTILDCELLSLETNDRTISILYNNNDTINKLEEQINKNNLITNKLNYYVNTLL